MEDRKKTQRGGPGAVWAAHGLSQSPFFSQSLEDSTAYPLELFRGQTRITVAESVLAHMDNTESSVTLIMGSPGVGKTSLINLVKFDAAQTTDYLVLPAINLQSGMNAELFSAELLAAMISAAEQQSVHQMRLCKGWSEAIALVRNSKTLGLRVGATAAVGGFEVERTATHRDAQILPPSAWTQALDDVRNCIRSHDLSIVIHLDNVDTICETSPAEAQQLFDDIRELLKTAGFHFIIGTTPSLVDPVLAGRTRVLRIMTNRQQLVVLADNEFADVVSARYKTYQIEDTPFIAPVTVADLGRLYNLFDGDLRAAFGLVEQSVIRAFSGTAATLPLTQIIQMNAHPLLEQAKMEVGGTARKLLELLMARQAEIPASELEEALGVSTADLNAAISALEPGHWVKSATRDDRQFVRLAGNGRLAAQAFNERKGGP